MNAERGTRQMRNGETADCTEGHGWRDRQAERNADWDGQFKYLTVRHLISDCTGGSCGNGEVRNRVLSVGQLKKEEGKMRSAAAHGHCDRYERRTGDRERLEMMEGRSRSATTVGRARSGKDETFLGKIKQN